MAAGTYLRTASSHVRTAMADLSKQIQSVQHDAYNAERQLSGEITKMEQEQTRKLADMAASEETAQTIRSRQEASDLKKKIDTERQHVQRIGTDAADAVRAKTNLLNELEKMASHLDEMAGHPDAN